VNRPPLTQARRRRAKLAGAVLLVGSLSVFGLVRADEEAARPTRLAVPGHDFSIVCPAGWEASDRSAPAAAACTSPAEGPEDFLENVVVMVTGRAAAEDAKGFLDTALSGNIDRIHLLERGIMQANGWTASTAIYRERDPSKAKATFLAAILGGDRAYLIMCSAESTDRLPDYRPQFDETIRSFELAAKSTP
jgi:hypothetical protein